jgi:hypothetical protein
MSTAIWWQPPITASGATLWTPANGSTLPINWVDLPDTATLTTSGSALISAGNKGTFGGSFSAPATTNRPTIQENTIGTLRGASFATDDILTLIRGSSTAFTAQSTFLVFRFGSTSSGSARFVSQSLGTNADTPNRYVPIIRQATTVNVGSFLASSVAAVAMAYDTWGLFQSIHNGTTLSNSLNAGTANTSTVALNQSFDRHSIGGSFAASGTYGSFSNMVSVEMLQYDIAVSGDLLARIQGYMLWRGSSGLQSLLPSGHAYKNAAPTL